MTEFTDEYVNLLIKQYWDKPRARAEIEMKAATWESIKSVLADFPNQFDIDASIIETELGLFGGFVLGLADGFVMGVAGQSSIGYQLDILGKIVGLTRQQIGEDISGETYRLLLKVKIGQNNASAFLVSDTRTTIQDVIELAFNGEAVVTDNYDMTMTLSINSAAITPSFINLILDNNLLPKPQGVGYVIVGNDITTGEVFGFSELGEPLPTTSKGFSELTYAPESGGKFAELYED